MTAPTKFSSTDLRVMHHQLAEWRQAQCGRARLPAEVWAAAAALAHGQGASAVARTLGLSYAKLRHWMGRPQPESAAAPPLTPGFVEWKWGPPPGSSSEPVGWAELRDASGRILRLHTGRDPQAWLALADSFWRRGR